MARGPFPVKAGHAAGGIVGLLTLGPLVAVILRAESGATLGVSDWAAVRFTVAQAALSAVFSVGLAIPVARALARRRFPGRGFMITLLGAPFILPVIVAVLGLLAVFGRSGVLNMGLSALGLPALSIYGLHGVVLAHVFFNMPLAVRLILQGWSEIPGERLRLAASLGFGPGAMFRQLEWPMLKAVVPGALMIVFLICLSSFAVALTLGGGPSATTVELAIYQAFRFEFDLGRAALLALIQLALTSVAAMVAFQLTVQAEFGAGLDRVVRRWDADRADLRVLDGVVLSAAALFLVVPLAMVVARGVPTLSEIPSSVWPAVLRSLAVAGAATAIVLVLALPVAIVARHARWPEALGYLPVAASPMVIGMGLFLVLFPLVDPVALALPLTAVVNALMALPFALRVLTPAVTGIETDYGRLADSLGLTGFARLRWLILPRLRPSLGFAAGLAAALSIGDLGVVALFAAPGAETLPLLIQRLMAAYRMDAAAGAALILLAVSFGIFRLLDWWGRSRAAM